MREASAKLSPRILPLKTQQKDSSVEVLVYPTFSTLKNYNILSSSPLFPQHNIIYMLF